MALDAVLIKTDQKSINEKQTQTTNSVGFAQQVYDLLLPFEIECTLEEIRKLIGIPTSTHYGEWINNFVTDKIIEKAGMPAFNGVLIKPELIRTLVVLPDTQELKNQIFHISNLANRKFSLDYLQLVAGVVSMTAGAFADITSKFTYYTANDRGAELAIKLLDYIDNFNDFNEYIGPMDDGTSGDKNYFALRKCDIPGLRYNDKVKNLELDLAFIRRQEALFADYVAV